MDYPAHCAGMPPGLAPGAHEQRGCPACPAGATHLDIAALTIVAVAGLLSGTVNSIAGGGSLLLFPALLGVGLPTQAANVTNSVANWPGFAGQIYGFAEDLKTQPRRRLVLLSVVTGIGSAAGSALLLATSSASFDQVVPALVLFASLLLAGQKQSEEAHAGCGSADIGPTALRTWSRSPWRWPQPASTAATSPARWG